MLFTQRLKSCSTMKIDCNLRLSEICLQMWNTNDTDATAQSPVVHRPAQTPLVLFRIVYFYCFQVSRSIES